MNVEIGAEAALFPEKEYISEIFVAVRPGGYTVKRVDEVVPHRHLVTQDQTTQVSNKFFHIHVENFTINIELFRHFRQTYSLQMSN
jgi:hypothetical protein